MLKRAFTLAMQAGSLMARPYVPKLQLNNVRSGFFEAEQFEAVRSRLSEDLQPVVTFLYVTGWRVDSEVLTLEWRQVDFKAGTITLDPGTTKNGEGRVFQMTPMRTLLLAQQHTDAVQRRSGPLSRVFHRKGQTHSRIPARVADGRRAAGVLASCGDFRRTAVRTVGQRAGEVAMTTTGHKTRSGSTATTSSTITAEAGRKLEDRIGTATRDRRRVTEGRAFLGIWCRGLESNQ